MNRSVFAYIDKQEEPKKSLLYEARSLLLKTIPECTEEFKWGVPVYDNDKFYIAAMKTRVHMGFAITGLEAADIEQLEGTGKTMRHIKIYSTVDLDEAKISKLIIQVHEKAAAP